MTLEEFKQAKSGRRLAAILNDPATVARMKKITGEGQPAVKAIDADVAETIGPLSNVERQHVGRWVKEVLAEQGFRPAMQRDWRGGRAFASGTVYVPLRSAPALGGTTQSQAASDRLAVVRQLLSQGRLDPEKPVGTVDGFLADRRKSWRDDQ
jgi:hypothetical protein